MQLAYWLMKYCRQTTHSHIFTVIQMTMYLGCNTTIRHDGLYMEYMYFNKLHFSTNQYRQTSRYLHLWCSIQRTL